MSKDMTKKTQPLYFMTWDEVEEGQSVLLVGATHPELTSGIIYTRKGDHLTFVTGTNRRQQASYTYVNYKYIPVPQDRPKPNIWDEYTGIEKNSFNGFKFYGFDGTSVNIHEGDIPNNPKQACALSAWINHVLDEGK